MLDLRSRYLCVQYDISHIMNLVSQPQSTVQNC